MEIEKRTESEERSVDAAPLGKIKELESGYRTLLFLRNAVEEMRQRIPSLRVDGEEISEEKTLAVLRAEIAWREKRGEQAEGYMEWTAQVVGIQKVGQKWQ